MSGIVKGLTFLVLILISTPGLSQDESNSLELVKNCHSEVDSRLFGGSCLLLGILALKKENKLLHIKIENLCVDLLSEEASLSYSYYENFLVYYPKCNYIIMSKMKVNKIKTFDEDKESEDLVRFLNSH